MNHVYIQQFVSLVSKMNNNDLQIALSKLDTKSKHKLCKLCNTIKFEKSEEDIPQDWQNLFDMMGRIKNIDPNMAYCTFIHDGHIQMSTAGLLPSKTTDFGSHTITISRKALRNTSEKIQGIKLLREIYTLSLRDAKTIMDTIDNQPVTIANLSDSAVNSIAQALHEYGYETMVA